MGQIIAILSGVLLAVQPLTAGAVEACDCQKPLPVAEELADANSDRCCDKPSDASESREACPEHDRSCGHDCDCPPTCGCVVKVPAATADVAGDWVGSDDSGVPTFTSERPHGAPHLRGLKRPPRV